MSDICEKHDEVGGCSQCIVEDFEVKEEIKRQRWKNPQTGDTMQGYIVGYCSYCRMSQNQMKYVKDEGWVCFTCYPKAIDVMLANIRMKEGN